MHYEEIIQQFPFPFSKRVLKKNEYLAQEGLTTNHFYITHPHHYKLFHKGKYLGELNRQMCGHIALLAKTPFPYAIQAKKETTAYFLTKDQFFEAIKNPDFSKLILEDMQTKHKYLEKDKPMKKEVRSIYLKSDNQDLLKSFPPYLKNALTDNIANADKVIEVKSDGFYLFDEEARTLKSKNLETITRYAADRSIGLVLGSGGARCISQLGVLKALEEANVPIDRIGGSGLGALIAALYACNIPIDTIYKQFKKLFKRPSHFIDYTFPYLSLSKGKVLTDTIKKLFKDIRIEELSIPFFCISSNLTTAKEYIHTEGLLWKAVRASVSIPGLFPPVCLDRHLLVDGSLTNLLPIDVMETFHGGGFTIAIDTSSKVGTGPKSPFPLHISGTKLFLKKLFPFGKESSVPSIIDTLLNSSLLDSSFKKQILIKTYEPHIVIKPPIQNFHSLDFKAMTQIYEQSYRYAKRHMTIWKRRLLQYEH